MNRTPTKKNKRINLFTANSTDFTHGGLSAFNYKYTKFLISKKYLVSSFFFNQKKYYDLEINKKNILKNNKFYKAHYIWIVKFKGYLNFFERIFRYNFLQSAFENIIKNLNIDDINISRKLELSIVLSSFKIKNVCLLDDPTPLQIKYNIKYANFFNKIYLFLKYILYLYFYSKLEKKFHLSKYTFFFTHSFQHIKFYKKFNIKVNYLPPFEDSQNKRLLLEAIKYQKKSKIINILFIGRANSTASKSFFSEFSALHKKLRLNKKFNFYIVSDENKINYSINNFNYFFIRKKNNLEILMKKMSLGLFLGDYNVGVRQRIIFMMSYGIPVVCHQVNKESLIHLINNKNIIFYDDDTSLVEKLNYYLSNKKKLIYLKKQAALAQRKFYDTNDNIKFTHATILKNLN
jgi:hypothetical protein